MDKCSIFLMMLHIFSCCSSVFGKMLDSGGGKKKHKKFSVSGFVLYANRKNEKKKKNWLRDACFFFLFFVIFKDMRWLLVPIPYRSCVLPDWLFKYSIKSWELMEVGYFLFSFFCLHNVIQVSFHNFLITRATPSSFGRKWKDSMGGIEAKGAIN